MKIKKKKLNKGYTLVELLAAASIIVIISGLVVGILYSTLRGGNRTKITNEVTQNSNYALSVISNTAINAESVTKIGGVSISDCTTSPSGSSIEFQQPSGQKIQFSCDTLTQSIASTSAGVTTYLIDTNLVKVDPTTCSFTCIQKNANPYEQPIITIKFKASQKTTAKTSENLASSSTSASITMRNYSPR